MIRVTKLYSVVSSQKKKGHAIALHVVFNYKDWACPVAACILSLTACGACTSLFPANETTNSLCGSPLAWAISFSCKKVSTVLQKKTKKFCNKLLSSSAQNIPVHVGEPPSFTLGETPRQLKKQVGIWQLFPCPQPTSKDTELSQKTILRHQKDCHEEDGAWSWEKYGNLTISQMPKMEHIIWESWLEHFDHIHVQRKERHMLDPHTAGGTPHAVIRKLLSNRQNLDHFGNPGTCGSKDSTDFPFAAEPRTEALRKSCTISLTRSTKNDHNQGRQAVHFTLVKPWDADPNNKYKASNHVIARHDAMYVVEMEGAQKKNFEFYKTINGCVVCFDTIPRSVHQKRSSASRTRQRHTPGFAVRLHAYLRKKNARDNVVKPDKEYLLCKGSQQRYLAGGSSAHDRSSTQKR